MSIHAMLTDQGPCVQCGTMVTIGISRDGGIPTVDATGYSGLTSDGDEFVCRDHYCPVCHDSHPDADAFDRCGFYGVADVDLTPPCSVDAANAVLGRSA